MNFSCLHFFWNVACTTIGTILKVIVIVNTIFGDHRLFDDFETTQGYDFYIWANGNNIKNSFV